MAPPAVPKEMKAVSLLHTFTVTHEMYKVPSQILCSIYARRKRFTHRWLRLRSRPIPFTINCYTQAFKVANQVANADAKQAAADTDSLSKDPSPLMQRKLADQERRSGSDNTDPSAKV